MKWREPGHPRRISSLFWGASRPFWAIGNRLSSLGTYLSFGPRPELDDGPDHYEITLGIWAKDEAHAQKTWERIIEAADGCEGEGWCRRTVTSGMNRNPEYDNTEYDTSLNGNPTRTTVSWDSHSEELPGGGT